jgi:hypothetical protein
MTTEAGTRLLDRYLPKEEGGAGMGVSATRFRMAQFVVAIEAEAVAQERARIRAAVEGLPSGCHSHSGLMCEQDRFDAPPWCQYCWADPRYTRITDDKDRRCPVCGADYVGPRRPSLTEFLATLDRERAAPSLDVERLARALHIRLTMLDGCRHPADDIAQCDNEADCLAREFAALREGREPNG